MRNPLEVLREKLENKSDYSGIRISRAGNIKISKDLIEKYDIGKVHGIDFVLTSEGVKVAITEIGKHKPLLFSSKKLLQGREKNEDGTIRIVEKDYIRGIQKNNKFTDSVFAFGIELFGLDLTDASIVTINFKERSELEGYTLYTKKPSKVSTQVFDIEIVKNK